jgi:hypothetical protein
VCSRLDAYCDGGSGSLQALTEEVNEVSSERLSEPLRNVLISIILVYGIIVLIFGQGIISSSF